MRSEPPAPTYLSGIATPDDKTVVFTLTRPDAMSFIFWVLDFPAFEGFRPATFASGPSSDPWAWSEAERDVPSRNWRNAGSRTMPGPLK